MQISRGPMRSPKTKWFKPKKRKKEWGLKKRKKEKEKRRKENRSVQFQVFCFRNKIRRLTTIINQDYTVKGEIQLYMTIILNLSTVVNVPVVEKNKLQLPK